MALDEGEVAGLVCKYCTHMVGQARSWVAAHCFCLRMITDCRAMKCPCHDGVGCLPPSDRADRGNICSDSLERSPTSCIEPRLQPQQIYTAFMRSCCHVCRQTLVPDFLKPRPSWTLSSPDTDMQSCCQKDWAPILATLRVLCSQTTCVSRRLLYIYMRCCSSGL